MSAVEQRSQPLWRGWLPVWAPLVFIAGLIFVLLLSWLPPSTETSTVIKGCRDGTLVLKRDDGEFRIVRPGAQSSWRAASDKVCEP
jgi:hypothetical protein